MLSFVALVESFARIQQRLPSGWTRARLKLAVSDPSLADRAAWLMGPTTPGRRGGDLFFVTGRDGTAAGVDHVRRLLRKLDDEGIPATLSLVDVVEAAPEAEPAATRTLVPAWDEELAKLPPDWTDLWCEVELTSSDYLERAALDMAPVNPASFGDRQGFRFRCARRFGYGTAPEMVRRCLERCDTHGIRGTVRILHVLCDTSPVGSQGPVLYRGGRVV
jgi:hypothetical protein